MVLLVNYICLVIYHAACCKRKWLTHEPAFSTIWKHSQTACCALKHLHDFPSFIKKKSVLKPNYYGTLLSLGLGNCSWGGLERVLRAGFRKWFPLRALSNGASANLIMSGKGVNVTTACIRAITFNLSLAPLHSLSPISCSLPLNIYLKAFKLIGMTFAGQQGRTKRKMTALKRQRCW